MALSEFSFLKCCQLCESPKKSDRTKGLKELSELLLDAEAIKILDKNSDVDNVNWNAVFNSSHRCLLKESETFSADENNGAGSSAAVSKRENTKSKLGSTVLTVVKKAKKLKCDNVISACLYVLGDKYLLKSYHVYYISILRCHVLPIREYWTVINYVQWKELLQTVLGMLTKKIEWTSWVKKDIFETLTLIVQHGCQQSHLALDIKHSLLPFLTREFIGLCEASIEHSLIFLTLKVCEEICKESRAGVCHLGETLIIHIMNLYDTRCDEYSEKNSLILSFLLSQVKLHHPHGSRQGSGAAFACDWTTWNRHLVSMYKLVINKIHRFDKASNQRLMLPVLLDLCVELCHQLNENETSSYDITVDETCSASKRRKVTIGVQGLIDELTSSSKGSSCWSLLSLLSTLLSSYPNLFKDCHLSQLLDQLWQLQCRSKDSFVMAYICKCSESLFIIMNSRKMKNSLWLKIWETTLRTIGLNQNESESHSLIQTLMSQMKVPIPGLQSLLGMFQSGMIRITNHSLQTLICLLSHFSLPVSSEHCEPSIGFQPWERQPLGAARLMLLEWLFPFSTSDTISCIELACLDRCAKLLVMLTLRIKIQEIEADRNELLTPVLYGTSFEEDYILSSFENGLMFYYCQGTNSDVQGEVISDDTMDNLIDVNLQQKLFQLLVARVSYLEQEIESLDTDSSTSSQGHRKSATKSEYKSELSLIIIRHVHLMTCVLSYMVEYGTLKQNDLQNCDLLNPLGKLLGMLGPLVQDALHTTGADSKLVFDNKNTKNLLTALYEMYRTHYSPNVGILLRESTPPGVIVPVAQLLSGGQPVRNDSFPHLDLRRNQADNKCSVTHASNIMDGSQLNNTDEILILCANILASFSCPDKCSTSSSKQKSVLSKLLEYLKDRDLFDTSQKSTFIMIIQCLHTVLNNPPDEGQSITSILEIVQSLCRQWNQDAEASSYILCILCDMLKHAAKCGKYERDGNICLIIPFMRKKFGPRFTLQLINVFNKIIMVDKYAKWTRWKCGSDLRNLVDEGRILPEALKSTKDANGLTAVVEELVIFLNSPFHEVRLFAIKVLTTLFTKRESDFPWELTFFYRVCAVVEALFILEVEDISKEEKMDESSNRTACVLHLLVALIGCSSQCSKLAVLCLLRLIKIKNISIELTLKTINLLPSTSKNFLLRNLPCLINAWFDWEFSIQVFPFQLMGFPTLQSFLEGCLDSILPLAFRKAKKDVYDAIAAELKSSLSDVLKVALPAIFSQYLPFIANDSLQSPLVKKQFDLVIELVGAETVTRCLSSSKLGCILVGVLQLLQDASHYESLLDVKYVLPEAKSPTITFERFLSALKHLQKSCETNTELLVYIALHRPSIIQQVLLQLRADICAPVMLYQKLLSLHQYCAFSKVLASHLTKGELSNIADFVVRDISHTLLYLIQDMNDDSSLADISYGSCRYLKLFCEQVLPSHADVVGQFLATIVGIIVPFTQKGGRFEKAGLCLLELVLVDYRKDLAVAISQLPPLPEAPMFSKMQEIHTKVKYGTREFTLQEEIVHFLGFVKKTNSSHEGCLLESLQFLKKKLAGSKNELQDLYKHLEGIRGFSEDCTESILHQLVCSLIYLGTSSNTQVLQEAARCLGELGPANLTTLGLNPADHNLQLAESNIDPLMLLLESVACLLSDSLLDARVDVVRAASEALYAVLATPKSDTLFNSRAHTVEKKRLSPFIPLRGTKSKAAVTKDKTKIVNMLQNDKIWCPDEDAQHKMWITSLVSELLLSFADDDSFFRLLVPLAQVKTYCAEKLLPLLLNLALHQSDDICVQVSHRIAEFFSNHSTYVTSLEPSQIGNSSNVYLNKVSIQCMLNAVNFIHFHKISSKNEALTLDLNYLHIARAAQFCSAYFSSIMYAELWCSEDDRWNMVQSGNLCAPVDLICENAEEDGKILQSLLREAYKQIGDHDAVYGCGSSLLVNLESRVDHYEHMEMWNEVLLYKDMQLYHSNSIPTTYGLVNAMKNCGLFHLMGKYLGALPAEQVESLQPAQLECMWRLGQWESPISPSSQGMTFEWSQYIALKSFHDGDKVGAIKAVEKGRCAVLSDLMSASLETCNNIYRALASFEALQNIEDMVSSNCLQGVVNKWNAQVSLPQNNFLLFELILAQRATLLESAVSHSSLRKNVDEELSLTQALMDLRLLAAKQAREQGKIQIAERWLHSLSSMPSLPKDFRWAVRLEEALLAWSRGKGAIDTDNNVIACQLLRSLLKELKSASNDSEMKMNLHARALTLYGTWMAESRSETPQLIIKKYMEEALSILKHSTTKTKLEAYYCLARFADLEYQRIRAYYNSEIFQRKQCVMEELRNDAKLEADRKAVSIRMKSSSIDEQEIQNTRLEREQFVTLALRYYLEALALGEEDENLAVFRLVSLWLENSSVPSILKLVNSYINRIQSYKFVVLLPQLVAGVGDSKDGLGDSINQLFRRCAIEHPYHTLPLVLAVAHSYKDPDNSNSAIKSSSDVRVVSTSLMIAELRKNSKVGKIVVEMEKLALALISFAYLPADKTKTYSVPKGEKIRQLQNLEHAMVPILTLPVQCLGQYNNIIGIQQFEGSFTVASGITKPKKIICIGTDGVKRPVLVKGKDDLRQDAMMQQVFAIMNTLLKKCDETNRRKLNIRTYKVVPLTRKCGILEWCEGTSPLGEILLKLHSKYYPGDLSALVCRSKIERARNASNAERLHVYQEVCKSFHPAFRYFFTEMYATPAEWFEHRQAYIHSVSTNSMVGYILGLGDRHVQNILVDQNTAELVHIDFGYAFEVGHILPTPETVPFRLTRDIEDGMGVSGIEGIFRRSCNKTMAVLHKNKDKILTILDVLLYDPLYEWTSSKKAASRQRGHAVPEISESPDNSLSSKEKNKLAERALSRLKQKLEGTEEGGAFSVEGQVNHLIQQARDPSNLSRLYCGWQAYL